jgi:hypothetical protein
MSFRLQPFAIYWGVWITMFLVPEIVAVFRNPADTLSDNWWALEHLSVTRPYFTDWTWQHWAMASVVWGLFAWLSVHLPFGLLR